ncbi:hypothetical protein [Roseateles depolymerans]|uniref:Uncharacterized protein n=1 Tax=Roseateles depolymerans TaxID=76731 RepID=A0A0U3MR01_9BURK|nr:hypothetical protein [Roseateles depolymerans]ALV06698.1 hypothetical protein RD2015_2226 [Roseateles depolymerans]REG19675.1 hypothetical protein DES44_2175 [Roseateles depolymerans]
MPLFLIEKDSSTKIPKDCSLEEAKAFLEQGFGVQRIGENGELLPLDENPYIDPSYEEKLKTHQEAEQAEEAGSDDAPDEVQAEQAPDPAPARKTAKKGK